MARQMTDYATSCCGNHRILCIYLYVLRFHLFSFSDECVCRVEAWQSWSELVFFPSVCRPYLFASSRHLNSPFLFLTKLDDS